MLGHFYKDINNKQDYLLESQHLGSFIKIVILLLVALVAIRARYTPAEYFF